MWNDLLTALALVFIIEGVAPFIAPERAKQVWLQISQLPSVFIRVMGLVSMLSGLVFLYIVH